MKKLVWLLSLVVLLVSCADDIIIEQGSELRGAYAGSYTIVWNAGSGTGSTTDWQYVKWTFSDFQFWCYATDTTLRDRITCDFSGQYKSETVMIFSDTIVEPGTCNHADIPVGEFGFNRIHDTLIFFQASGGEFDRVEKTIKLVTDTTVTTKLVELGQ